MNLLKGWDTAASQPPFLTPHLAKVREEYRTLPFLTPIVLIKTVSHPNTALSLSYPTLNNCLKFPLSHFDCPECVLSYTLIIVTLLYPTIILTLFYPTLTLLTFFSTIPHGPLPFLTSHSSARLLRSLSYPTSIFHYYSIL